MHAADSPSPGPAVAGGVTPSEQELVDERTLSKLRWRCRRGLLENDLLIERFLNRYQNRITRRQATALTALMELSDPDLLDLLLARKSLSDTDAALDDAAIHELLTLLKEPQP